MKHIAKISKTRPRSADAFQEFICYFVTTLVDILTALGGEAPFLTYLADKCNVPEPNPE